MRIALCALAAQLVEYDLNGNRTLERVRRSLPAGGFEWLVTQHEYDAQNRVIKTWNPLGQYTETSYNSLGKPDWTEDVYRARTEYLYDRKGNLVQTKYPGDLNPAPETYTLRTVSRTVYDAHNRPIYTQDRVNAPANDTDATFGPGTKTEYDGLGRVTKRERLKSVIIILSESGTGTGIYEAQVWGSAVSFDPPALTETVYNAAGQVTWVYEPGGIMSSTEYDSVGRRREQKRYYDQNWSYYSTQFEYDDSGNLTSTTDAQGRVTEYEYDALNRRVLTRHPLVTGAPALATERVQYDALGRRVAAIDAAGVTTGFSYDGVSRLVSVTNDYRPAGPNPFVTRYSYDELGNQLTQVDALGRVTRYEYDAVGRRTKRILPEKKPGNLDMFETVAYELTAPRQTHTDFNGKVTTLIHDPLGRLRQRNPDPSFGAQPVVFSYFPNGQREYMSDDASVSVFAYDEQNRLVNKQWVDLQTGFSYELAYGHHPDGSLSGITNNSAPGVGTSVSYEWNKLRQLAQVTDHRLVAGAQTTTYAYHPVGSLQSCVYPNGVSHAYTCGEQNRRKDLSVNGSGLLAKFEYTVGPSGNRTKVVEPVSELTPTSRTIQWNYERLYRLTRERITGGSAPLSGTID